jgi:hypothetical protein
MATFGRFARVRRLTDAFLPSGFGGAAQRRRRAGRARYGSGRLHDAVGTRGPSDPWSQGGEPRPWPYRKPLAAGYTGEVPPN